MTVKNSEGSFVKMMGWTNDKMLRYYAQLNKETVFNDVAKLETEQEKLQRRTYGNSF